MFAASQLLQYTDVFDSSFVAHAEAILKLAYLCQFFSFRLTHNWTSETTKIRVLQPTALLLLPWQHIYTFRHLTNQQCPSVQIKSKCMLPIMCWSIPLSETGDPERAWHSSVRLCKATCRKLLQECTPERLQALAPAIFIFINGRHDVSATTTSEK